MWTVENVGISCSMLINAALYHYSHWCLSYLTTSYSVYKPCGYANSRWLMLMAPAMSWLWMQTVGSAARQRWYRQTETRETSNSRDDWRADTDAVCIDWRINVGSSSSSRLSVGLPCVQYTRYCYPTRCDSQSNETRCEKSAINFRRRA